MQGDPLVTISGVTGKIAKAEDIIDSQRIDSNAVELPRIAEIDILPDLHRREQEQRAIIAGPEQDTGILRLSLVEKDPGTKEILEKGSPLRGSIIVGIDAGIPPVEIQLPVPTAC